jgi:uncharacterized protein (DUF169 family)
MVKTAHIQSLEPLRLANAPVAVAFLPAPPPGLARMSAPLAAGCSYWKEASEGRAFYTTGEHHQNCPVGAYTHGVTLSEEKGKELQSMLGTMVELRYLTSAEIPGIPHRSEPMQVTAYAPLANTTFTPDAVIFRGNVRQIMLLSEAARAAGALDTATAMGRPACAALPQAISSTGAVTSVGCIGNRVYTGLGDDEMYLVVPGPALDNTLEQLAVIMNANAELEKFHRGRLAAMST